MFFGPGNNPRLSIGPRNQVTVDAAGKIHLIDDLDEYKKTVGPRYVCPRLAAGCHSIIWLLELGAQ
jgi:hypothetical protein